MNQEIYIDFDGVIADTQKKINYYFSLFDYKKSPDWDMFLADINWKIDVLSEAKEIKNSFTILKELYKMKKNIYILSRVFSLQEAKDKIEYLRDNGVYTSFITSPGRIDKSKVIIPTQNKILIDDSKDNVLDWVNNNGKGIYFAKNNIEVEENKKNVSKDRIYCQKDNETYFRDSVEDLSFLLKNKSM